MAPLGATPALTRDVFRGVNYSNFERLWRSSPHPPPQLSDGPCAGSYLSLYVSMRPALQMESSSSSSSQRVIVYTRPCCVSNGCYVLADLRPLAAPVVLAALKVFPPLLSSDPLRRQPPAAALRRGGICFHLALDGPLCSTDLLSLSRSLPLSPPVSLNGSHISLSHRVNIQPFNTERVGLLLLVLFFH